MEAAVDDHRRVPGTLKPSAAADEIGDLSRSFTAMIERLREYNQYLENMGRRLSHELRTPLAVVRSSLENLQLENADRDARPFVGRAKQDLSRLHTIITRMSDATRLEQALQASEPQELDLRRLLAGLLEGYRNTWPGVEFRDELASVPLLIRALRDLMAQMVDKIVANAVEFRRPGTPTLLTSYREGRMVHIEVENIGPGHMLLNGTGLYFSPVTR